MTFRYEELRTASLATLATLAGTVTTSFVLLLVFFLHHGTTLGLRVGPHFAALDGATTHHLPVDSAPDAVVHLQVHLGEVVRLVYGRLLEITLRRLVHDVADHETGHSLVLGGL